MESVVSRLSVFSLFLLMIALAACAPETPPARFDITLVAPEDVPTTTFTDPQLVQGETSYNLLCAHCHGYNGEGQLEATIANTRSLGMNLVPPSNADGHMWEHPDQLLIRVVQEGIQNPLDQFPMPSFGEGVTESEIRAIFAYIRLWWTEEQVAHQAQVTQNWTDRLEALGLTTPTAETTENPG